MLLVLCVGDRFQEVGVSPGTAAILGRAGTSPFDAAGIPGLQFSLNNPFKLDAVLPAISEVVLIDKRGVLAARYDLAQQDGILIFHFHTGVQVI